VSIVGADFLLPALILGVLGGFTTSFGKFTNSGGDSDRSFGIRGDYASDRFARWWKKHFFATWLIRSVALFLLTWWIMYIGLPGRVGPFYSALGSILMIYLWVSAITDWMSGCKGFTPAIAPIVMTFLIMAAGCGGCSVFRADDYRNMLEKPNKKNWTEDTAPVDTKHIREVSKPQAKWMGNKALGQDSGGLGSRYKPGNYTIQEVGNHLYWISALQFNGFSKWWSYGETTGYIMVSAQDKSREPELHTGFKFKYLPTTWFSKNLHRYLYSEGYTDCRLREFSFELDDDFRPWYVVTVLRPTISYWGEKIEGVVIVNPETGDHKFYAVDEVPDWVDRVYPEETTEKYLAWWGYYVMGWWNGVWAKENVIVPTAFEGDTHDVWFVKADDGEKYWFTGMTSASSTDQALCGVMMVNTRTGKTIQYEMSGINEKDIVAAINDAVSNYTGFRGEQPILYNVWGEPTCIAPVISAKGIFQFLAAVRVKNGTVVLGKTKNEVLSLYRSKLASDGEGVAPSSIMALEELEFTVDRINSAVENGYTNFYFYSADHPDKVFKASIIVSPEVVLTEKGSRIEVKFLDTDEPVVEISEFDLAGLDLRKSDVQEEYEKIQKPDKQRREKRESAEDIRDEIGNLSDEDLIRRMEKKDSATQ